MFRTDKVTSRNTRTLRHVALLDELALEAADIHGPRVRVEAGIVRDKRARDGEVESGRCQVDWWHRLRVGGVRDVE